MSNMKATFQNISSHSDVQVVNMQTTVTMGNNRRMSWMTIRDGNKTAIKERQPLQRISIDRPRVKECNNCRICGVSSVISWYE